MEKITSIKKGSVILLMGVLALAALAGCSDSDPETQEQENQDFQTVMEKLDALQTQMSDIEAHLGGEADDDQPQIVMAGVTNAQQFLKQLGELEDRVSAAAVTIDSTVIPESEDERPVAYFQAIAPLEELQADLDLIEDAFITAHGKGTVNSNELWQLEARKGEIEDMILLAEDSLEFRMSAEN